MLSIPDYFKGKNVFITGGTGFLGKVLIEKILRSCPDVGAIYLLIRNKKGKNLQERIKNVTDDMLFGPLKEQNPLAIDKINAIAGNIDELKLGLSEKDETFLTSQIDIIYHCAASINFDLPLRSATITNVRSAREMAQFALKCKHLELLVHVSTMYSNCDRFDIEEKLYPPLVDWRAIIEMAEDECCSRDVEILTQKYIHPFPNTYTFTKKIAEEVLTELCKDKVPLIIVRPSIVIHVLKEPLIGWIDNFNGPFSIVLTMFKGISDCSYGNSDSILDKVFVDNVIKTMIIATWKHYKNMVNSSQPIIYNVCSDVLWELREYSDCRALFWEIPVEDRLTYNYEADVITNSTYFYLWFTLFNVIPAIFVDILMRVVGRKPIVLKVLRRLYIANVALEYFMKHTFTFHYDRYLHIEDGLIESDKEAFAFRADIISDKLEIAKSALIGLKKYLLHEKYPISPKTLANTKKLYIFHYAVYWLKVLIALYLLIWRWNIPGLLYNKMYNYVEDL